MCPGLGTKIRRLIWPCSADDDVAARRLGWSLHDSVLKQNHVAARVNRLLHDSLGSRGDFQNACFLRFVSPRFCLQSLSLVILLRSPFASSPSLAAYSLLVPHSFSIPSFVRNLGKFSNSIPLLMIFDRRFLVRPFDPRPETMRLAVAGRSRLFSRSQTRPSGKSTATV